jgi:hypothetical protein
MNPSTAMSALYCTICYSPKVIAMYYFNRAVDTVDFAQGADHAKTGNGIQTGERQRTFAEETLPETGVSI